MSKKQIAGVVIGVLLTGILFSLPQVVVNNEEPQESEVTQPAMAKAEGASPDGEEDHEGHEHESGDHDHDHEMHMGELSLSDRQIADRLREKFEKSENLEKSAIFADSLAVLYANASRYDSAAFFAGQALAKSNTISRLFTAGSYNLEAFKYTMEPAQQQAYAKKAESYLSEVLEKEPGRLEAKSKLAMIYVSSENPMKGIRMLQEVLEKDPDNVDALFNMGILSVQSGQYEKAAERFEHYTRLQPANAQAQFYLAYSYLQLGRKAKAKEGFLKVKELDKSPDVVATVDEYLKDL